jgi:hypothetical protein
MRWMFGLRTAAAMIIGYVVIVLLTTYGFNALLGRQPLYGNSALVLAEGMLVAVVSGLVGGYIAGWLGPSRGLINASFVLIPLTIDTIYVLFFFGGSRAPWWFDTMASGTLMAFTLLGGWLTDRNRVAIKSGAT